MSVYLEYTVFIFVLTIQLESRDCTDEILALKLARTENNIYIVSFFGAYLKGRSAVIFMEFMEGKKRLIVAFFMHCGSYNLMLLEKIKRAELRRQ